MKMLVLRENLAVRLPHWTNCVVEIEDIGKKTFWGNLVDIKTDEIIEIDCVFDIDDDWRLALDVDTVIDNF